MKGLRIVLSLSILFLCFAFKAYSQEIKPGLWEITTTVEIPGMPSNMKSMMNTLTNTYQQCISEEDPFPKPQQGMMGGDESSNCKVVKSESNENNLKWIVECMDNGEKTVMSGDITYNGNSFEGTMNVEGQETNMTIHMKGSRIGDCKGQ